MDAAIYISDNRISLEGSENDTSEKFCLQGAFNTINVRSDVRTPALVRA